MRSLIRAAFVAVALTLAIPTASVLAQTEQAAQSQAGWTTIPLKNVPVRVTKARMRLFPRTKVTKAEQSGSGAAAVYKFKLAGKAKEVKFDAAGKVVK